MKFKIFLINMKKSPERLAFMSNQLKSLGLPFSLQEGVDGKVYDFKEVYDEESSMRLNGASLAPVEKGCALSHRLAFEKAIAEDVEYTLILEDDVELPLTFKKIFDEVLSKRDSKKTDWEYLSFNYPTVGLKFVKLWLFLLKEQFTKNPSFILYIKIPLYIIKFLLIVVFSVYEGLRDALYKKLYAYGKPTHFYRPLYLAGCYLVTKEGVKKLLSVQKKIIYPADRIQNVARIKKGLKLFHFVPLIVKQRRDKFESTMYQNNDYVFSEYD